MIKLCFIRPSKKGTGNRTTKYTDYEAHGVLEYQIVDSVKKKVAQYILINSQYQLRFADSTGTIRSEALKAFAIETEDIFNNVAVLKLLQPLIS